MKKLSFFLLCMLAVALTSVNAQNACNAAFGWQANPSGNNLFNVDFTNNSTATASPGGNIISESYILYGDGNGTSFYSTSSHNYAAAGTYTVTVIINSSDSTSTGTFLYCTDTVTQNITISGSPCASTFSTQSNGSGSHTFTANNPAGTSGMTYTWNFGDNTSGTGNPVTHSYNSNGNYTVTLTSTGGGCTYTNIQTINSYTSPFNCSVASTDFSSSISNSDVYFSNLSTGNQGISQVNSTGAWDFGDGSTGTNSMWGSTVSHSYAATGTYTVSLVNTWTDSLTSQVVCTKTASHTVTITTLSPPPQPNNIISGRVNLDTVNNSQYSDTIQVWLIVHDVISNTLTAVDSERISAYPAQSYYQFFNKPAGNYLVKAAYLGQTPGTAGYLPTYHQASVYWSGATTIAHTNGTDDNKDIHLQNGIVTSGLGFIGGNISAGAGRGTGTGVQGMLVFLRNSSNQLITSAVTDADGDFSFSNLPTGSYSVYPEAINYMTTPYNTITVTTAEPNVEAIDFVQTETEIKPKTVTGIAKVSEKDGIKIYPNPALNLITIENKNGLFNQVKIVNAVGQMIKQVSLKTGVNKIDINEMNAGIYYLLMSGSDGLRSMKFVKQ